MPKIDFYILQEKESLGALHFACQLIEKMHHAARKIYVYMDSQAEAERFDTLLWTYKEDSFLPHTLYQANSHLLPATILIGYGELYPSEPAEVLVNLSRQIPPFYRQFAEMIEIVFSEPSMQQLARDRFRHYRAEACEIITHK